MVSSLDNFTLLKLMLMKFYLISLLFFAVSCNKGSGKSCPLQTYTIECSESMPDLEFGGYVSGTNQYIIEANCPEDAIKMAKDMSYDIEGSSWYKHCYVIP